MQRKISQSKIPSISTLTTNLRQSLWNGECETKPLTLAMRDSASRYEKLLGYTRRKRFTVKQYCVEGYMGLISAPPRIRKVLRYGLVYKYTEDWTNRSVKVHCKSTKTFPILVCIFSCTHVHAPTVIKKYTLLTVWQKYFSSNFFVL